MGNSKDEPSVPKWQQANADAPATSSTIVQGPATIEQAKKFLQDEEVRRYPRQKKTEFLKSKGLSESDVQELIAEETNYVTAPAEAESSPKVRFHALRLTMDRLTHGCYRDCNQMRKYKSSHRRSRHHRVQHRHHLSSIQIPTPIRRLDLEPQ